MNTTEKKKILSTLFIPFLFLLLMWLVKVIEVNFQISLVRYGVFPQTIDGLKGILFSPFIHKDFTHLINNSYPILILGGMLFAVYRKIAIQLFIWLYFIAGLWLWVIGRPSFHIGASGLIYALASFLLVSGLIRKNPRLVTFRVFWNLLLRLVDEDFKELRYAFSLVIITLVLVHLLQMIL